MLATVVLVRAQTGPLVAAVHRHLARRVRAVLGTAACRVRSVTLRLSDVNGPRGGADLRCTVAVELEPTGTVRAEATDCDLFSAIGRALARARRAIRDGDGRREALRMGSVVSVS